MGICYNIYIARNIIEMSVIPVYMRVENLRVGMVVESYKEMCKLLNEPVKGQGTSRNCQFKDWQRFFTWHRIKNTFVIDEIYPVAKRKVDRRGNPKNYCNYDKLEDME